MVDAVLHRKRPFDEAFSEETRSGLLSTLAERDKALARAIAAMTLRRKGQTDAVLAALLDRPLARNTGQLSAILRCALTEILFMDAPDHAVVNLAVHQAGDDRRTSRFTGLVNAVLRRAAREGAAMTAKQDAPRVNCPDWLWQSWEDAYGVERTRATAAAYLEEAPLDLSVKRRPGVWAEKLGGQALPSGTVRLEGGGRIEALEGFEEGAWWVQDAAAALPVRLLGDVAGLRVADLCAAPGGKTAQLASAGARVTAVDISGKRLRRLEENLRRLDLHVEVVEADARDFTPAEPFDAVLLDAPCTATGTFRRHPDIPHLKTPSDLERLATVQAHLLDSAADLLRPGGTLVYCTCSLQPEEGEAQVSAFLERASSARLEAIDIGVAAGLNAEAVPGRGLRTWPFRAEEAAACDGFFMARLTLEAS